MKRKGPAHHPEALSKGQAVWVRIMTKWVPGTLKVQRGRAWLIRLDQPFLYRPPLGGRVWKAVLVHRAPRSIRTEDQEAGRVLAR